MFFRRLAKEDFGKKCVTAILLLAFVCTPFNSLLQPKQAEAQWAVFDAANFEMNSITAAASSLSAEGQTSLLLKEWTFDGIAFMLLNLILHEMSQSIITWINSGFQGSPSFVQDLDRFLIGIADKVAGDYIWGTDLNFLCSPFKLDIRMALDIQYKKSRDYKVMCTLSGISNNIIDFAKSASPTANWDTWFQVSTKPENNQYGSFLLAQENMGIKISNAKGKELSLLSFGKGFLSKTKCEKVEGIEKCGIVTPGSTIEAQLNNTLDSGQRRVQVADEINEIIAALFTQLAKQAFAGAAGLLGLTQSNGSGGNYYDELSRTTDYGGFTSTSSDPIEKAIVTEKKWRDLRIQQAALLQGAKDYWTASCMSGTAFSTDLQSQLTSALTGVVNANTTIEVLTDMADEIADAAGTPDAAATKARVMQEYMDMQSSDALHNEVAVMSFKLIDLKDTEEGVAAYKATIDQACNEREQT